MPWLDLPEASHIQGLSETKAAELLETEGHNEILSARRRSLFLIVLEVLREPMFLLLVAAGSVYLVLGDVQEALMLLGFVSVIIGITVYQERKTERALEALRDLSSPRALVIRDGQQKRIAGREVVRGDILVISEGDRVPADGVVEFGLNLSADESLLTGESVPVRKKASQGLLQMAAPGGDGLPFVYSGTLVVRGRGIARVLATGTRTEMGKIGRALERVQVEGTRLQAETRAWVGLLAAAGLLLCTAVVVLYGLTRGNWLDAFLAGIATAMSLLPEELPVILTVFLALGAWRISQKRVLTRRVPAVEALGQATVLCVDKTGTITANRMTVSRLFDGHHHYDLGQPSDAGPPEAFHELVEYSILASQSDPFDPMEKAIRQMGETALARTEHLHSDWSLVREYPLSDHLLALSHVWKSLEGIDYLIAAKGAPEAIADLCHFSHGQMETLSTQILNLASGGMRVLGVARATFRPGPLPHEQHDFRFEFLGLVGLIDPVRPGVPEAVQECYTAGIRIVMITGDYAGTAEYVGRQIGLERPDEVITGPELGQMNDLELKERIKGVNIFARVVPEQKLRLVNALKANGEIVAMTGDGVNDAPALKAAHIGIAMGGRGTDVAREAAALVVLDDDFASIVQAVRMGRRIFDNIQKAVAYTLAVHVPIAGMALVPVVFQWPLVLLPVHIVFLELIIDPACSVVFEAEPEEAGIMTRPPRNPAQPLFSPRTILLSLLQGAGVFVFVLAVFMINLFRDQDVLEARTLAFTTLIVANLALIFTNRSWSRTIPATLRTRNAALWWVIGGAVAFLGLVLYVPWLQNLFLFATLHPNDLGLSLFAGLLGITWFELLKLVRSRWLPGAGQEVRA